jgi:hypothetical protein
VALPPAQLADYKNAIRAAPHSASEYWTTIAAIINYQSFIDQVGHHAPDPAAISQPCGNGLTGGPSSTGNHSNAYDGMHFEGCIVDLDTNKFTNSIFHNSVVRYHGGPVFLSDVQFINCRFVLDIPVSAPASPERNSLLMTLLDAPSTKSVTVPSTHS